MSWPRAKLKEEASVITKGTTPTTLGYSFTKTGVPFIRAQNLVDGTVSVSADPLFVSDETHQALKRSKIYPKDVLISIAGTIGRASVVPDDAEEMNCNQAVAIVRPSDRIDRRFILHWLSSTDAFSQVSKSKVTGVISNLSLGQIGALQVPLPPLEEQRRIAGILDAADALRRRRSKALALLDTLPGAIFAKMFGDPAKNERGWPARPVGEVCELLNGKAFKPSDWTDEGVPIIRIQNLNDSTKPFNKTLRRFDDRFYIRKGDCLFSWSGTPGTSFGCFDWQGPEGWLNQHIFKVTTAPDVAPSFFRHQMNIRMNELIAKAHGGVGLQHVTKGMITEMNFLVPPEEHQSKFVDAVARHDQNVFQGRQHLAHLNSLFASLQSRAFAGEL